jgi:hypothetical protein
VAAASDELSYGYKTSLLGAAWNFRLTDDAIVWQKGRHSGRIAFTAVRRVRMTYRPATMQTHRFVTEIWSTQGPKLTFASTSWKSMMESERRDSAYSTFVTELHRRLSAANPAVAYAAGVTPAIYWSGLAVYIALGLGLTGLIMRSLREGAWSGAAIIAVFVAVYLWNGNFFRRNRPARYLPNALPELLMPTAG